MKAGRQNPKSSVLRSQKGIALILTLMAIALITAMVTEFAYAVYTGTNSLHNWYDSQRLSVYATSGINMAMEFVSDNAAKNNNTYQGFFDWDFKDTSNGFNAKIHIRVEDENSKFNINTIVYPNGAINENAYNSFKRLLSYLFVDMSLADYIADWIDTDTEERRRGSENTAKNAYIDCIDELLLVKGMDKAAYEKLLPYITVYGDGLVNINSAEKPVLISLSEGMTDEFAQRVVDFRKAAPFDDISQLQKVAGFDLSVYGPLSAKITVKGKYFYVRASAEGTGIQRMIEAVIGTSRDVKYWRET